MANETMGIMFNAMGVMFNMVNCMPKGKGKRADEQYDDQRFNERVSGVEIHSYYYMGLSRVVGLPVRLFVLWGTRLQLSN